eukprot:gene32046-16579_t
MEVQQAGWSAQLMEVTGYCSNNSLMSTTGCWRYNMRGSTKLMELQEADEYNQSMDENSCGRYNSRLMEVQQADCGQQSYGGPTTDVQSAMEVQQAGGVQQAGEVQSKLMEVQQADGGTQELMRYNRLMEDNKLNGVPQP